MPRRGCRLKEFLRPGIDVYKRQILGIIGLVLSSKAKEEGYDDNLRMAGFVLSLIGIIGGAFFFVACVALSLIHIFIRMRHKYEDDYARRKDEM